MDLEPGQPIEIEDIFSPEQADQAEQEILLSPDVLTASADKLVETYSNRSRFTPEYEYEYKGKEYTFVVVRGVEERHRSTVLAVKKEDQYHKFVIFNNDELLSANNKPLELGQRAFVRDVLDRMHEAFQADIEEAVDSVDLEAILESEAQKTEEQIQELENRVTSLRSAEDLGTFRIRIASAWASSGEKALDLVYEGSSLVEALKQSLVDFMELNERSDVQASGYSIHLVVNGQEVTIPRQLTDRLFIANSKWDREEHLIEKKRREKGLD